MKCAQWNVVSNIYRFVLL